MRTYQLGVGYTGNTGEAQLSAYYAKQSNIIGFVYVGKLLVYQNQSVVSAVRGVELEGKYYLNKSLLLLGSILAQEPVYDNQYTGYSNFGAKAGVSYNGKFGAASLYDVHQGSISQTLYNPQSSNPKPGTYDILTLNAKLDLNNVLSLSAGPKYEIFIQGDNLLNKELWTSSISDGWPESLPFKKGHVYYLGLKASF